MVLSAFVAPFSVPSIAHAASTTVFSDGFEATPAFPNWDSADAKWQNHGSGSVPSYEGTRLAHVSGNTQGSYDYLTKSVDTSGYENLTLSFYYQHTGLDNGDILVVEWYDGSAWHGLGTIDGVDGDADDVEVWTLWSQPLPSGAEGNADFQFRLGFIANVGNDKLFLDAVGLDGDEVEDEIEASLMINTPVENEEVTGTYDFTATYVDDDDEVDTINWAIRADTCNVLEDNTVAGNVGGFNSSSTFVGTSFSATLDTSSWEPGVYCFDVNPDENDDGENLRDTVLFIIPEAEAPEVCSYDGEVVEYTDPAFQNDNDPVDPARRNVTAVEAGVAPYANFFGKEGNDWQVDPLDFFSLGIEGELVYEFTDKVAVDQPGADIAIWEITGGAADQQTDESADVYVSADGDMFYMVGSITGDGTVDISGAPIPFAKFVKLVDTSLGVQGNNGDGFDLDAITIIDGACQDFSKIVAHKIVCTDEADLPNWGSGGPTIDADTAADWVAEHKSCDFARGWEFQWGPQSSYDPGDTLIGEADDPWTTFGPTDGEGMTMTLVTEEMIGDSAHLWFREVLQEGYIPFTHEGEGNKNIDEYTAEVYCQTDVLNYDNYDRIDNVDIDETYYCVAWNHEAPDPLVCDPEVNLLENPSFEEPVVETQQGWDIFETGTPGLAWLTEWIYDGPGIGWLELHRSVNGWASSDGAQHAELDGDWQGPGSGGNEPASVAISQIVPTIPGEQYTLMWDFSPRPDTSEIENDLVVFVNGDDIANNSAAGGSDVDWQSDSYSFEAEAPVTAISFADAGRPNSVGTFLDNVGLYCMPQPEQCELQVVSDANTVVVENNDYATSTYEHPNWTADIDDATWIWDSYYVVDPEVDTTRTFRETFEIATPTSGTLDVAADNGYLVYLNGSLVADRSLPTYENNFQSHTQKTYDVTSFLVDGENELEIIVTNKGVEGSNNRSNPAGVLYRLVAEGADVEGSCEVTTEPEPEEPPLETHIITGYKWEDTDGDGEWDQGEPGIEGWTIFLDDEATTTSTTTDETGRYSFEVEAGWYEVYEEQREGWTQTAPTSSYTLVSEVVDNGNGSYGSCTYHFYEDDVLYTRATSQETIGLYNPKECNFGNQPDEEDDPEEENGGGGGGSSTHVDRPTPQVLGASTAVCPFLRDYMQIGWDNNPWEVIKLQLFLSMVMGYDNPITGIFDRATDLNVKRFQNTFHAEVLTPWFDAQIVPHREPTGFVYKTTKWKINDIVCPGDPFPSFEGEDLTRNVDID